MKKQLADVFNKSSFTYGKDAKIEDVMNKDIQEVAPDMSIFEAYKYMRTHKYDMAPVIDKDEFKGILDTDGINEFFMIQKALLP